MNYWFNAIICKSTTPEGGGEDMSSTRKHYKYEYLTSRWGGMQLREEMDSRIVKWLSGFSEEEQQIMLELLSNFY